MDWEAESNKSAREDLLQSRFAVQYEARWIGSAMPMERVAMNRVDHCGCMGAIWITVSTRLPQFPYCAYILHSD